MENRHSRGFDSDNTPTLALPHWDLIAQFWLEGGEWTPEGSSEAGILLYVSSDQVRFRDAARNPVNLADVPPIVFSEVMRDVDLFVGVASVGNDPNWIDQGPAGHRAYWHAYAFGDLSAMAETRRDVLARLLPRLKIADRCQVQGRFLRVQGRLRAYKIHLGSGNILMEPNDAYLCIVPGRPQPGADKIYLPFEGDAVLAIILSKAFLLTADDRINDPSIAAQIHRR